MRTTPRRALPLGLAVVALPLAACHAEDEALHREITAEELSRPTYPLAYRVSADETLLAYAWDDRPRTPALRRDRDGTVLDFGAPGLTGEDALYLPFDEGPPEDGSAAAARRVRDLAAPGRAALPTRCEWTSGRFGHGLRLGPDSLLEVGAVPLGAPFTVQLWIRPRRGLADAPLLEIPGLLALRLRDGRVELSTSAPDGVRFTSEAELEEETWSHVAVSLAGAHYPHLRLIVDDKTCGLLLPAPPAAPTGGLRVGGGFEGDVDELRVRPRAVSSAELFETWRAGAEIGEHRLTLEFEGGTRVERLWAGAVTEPLLTAALLARGASRHTAVVGESEGAHLAWTAGHWQRDRASAPPMSRTTHPTVYVGERRTFVLGGELHDSHTGPMINTADTWIYHSDERRWESIAGPVPPPRCHQPAAYSPDHGIVLIAGGMHDVDGRWVRLADTWVYHVAEGRWEERHPAGAELPPLSDSGLVYHPVARRFVLFNNRWVLLYDPEANTWERRTPPERVDLDGNEVDYHPGGSFMAGYDPRTGQVVIFGGERKPEEGGHVFQNTLVHYDYDANRFVVQDEDPPPPPRVRAGFAYDSRRGEFLLYGGVLDQESERLADLWSYRASDNRWRRLDASNAPTPRGGYMGMSYDPDADACFVLCGRLTYTLYSDEAWRLRIDETATGTATYVFDRAAFPEVPYWGAAWNGPADSAPDFRFAGSTDGLAFGPWTDQVGEAASGDARFVKVEVRLPAPGAREPIRVGALGFVDAKERLAQGGTRTRVERVAALLSGGTR